MTYPLGWLGRVAGVLVCGGAVGAGCGEPAFQFPDDPYDTMADECEYDTSGPLPAESEGGLITASVDCEPAVDCSSDQRNILLGTQLQYRIRAPEPAASTQLRAESTDEDVIAVTFDSIDSDPCDGAIFLEGTASFDEVGEAAVVVYDGDEEVDRFNLKVDTAASLEVQAVVGDDVFGLSSDYEPVDRLSIETIQTLRLIVRGEAGERLIGARDILWTLADQSSASLSVHSGANVRIVITPRAVGMTTLTVRAAGLSTEIPVEVTDTRSPRADGGIED